MNTEKTMGGLYADFNAMYKNHSQKMADLMVAAETAQTEARMLQTLADEKSEKAKELFSQVENAPKVNWIENIVKPLAKEMENISGLHSKIQGPIGVCGQVEIVLMEDADKDVWNQDTQRLTLRAARGYDNIIRLVYETGELIKEGHVCPEGSLGAVSGMNNATAPLPDDLKDVLALFRLEKALDIR